MLDRDFKLRLKDFLRNHFESEKDARLATVFRFTLLPDYGPDVEIGPGALVQLREVDRGAVSLAFLIPNAGGHVSFFEGHPVRVLGLDSPLGSRLLGLRMGEVIELGSQTFRIECAV